MFIGTYLHSIDKKGRLFIPAKFRGKVKPQKFVITVGQDDCLYMYSENKWEKLSTKFENLQLKKKNKERAFKRIFFAGASDVEVDVQGRILIPQNLRSYAKIKNDVVINGVSDRIEIWSKSLWTRYNKLASKTFKTLSEELDI